MGALPTVAVAVVLAVIVVGFVYCCFIVIVGYGRGHRVVAVTVVSHRYPEWVI